MKPLQITSPTTTASPHTPNATATPNQCRDPLKTMLPPMCLCECSSSWITFSSPCQSGHPPGEPGRFFRNWSVVTFFVISSDHFKSCLYSKRAIHSPLDHPFLTGSGTQPTGHGPPVSQVPQAQFRPCRASSELAGTFWEELIHK